MSLHAFPRQLTSFVGRERETDEVISQLQQPNCRLLTLVGPGGMGKTRLSIQVGTALQTVFDDVYFVALQAVDSPDQLPLAIAEAIGVTLADHDPVGQLVDALNQAKRLLILDNFEQLLDEAAMLAELLYATPELKLLVTSREIINIPEEWIYPVEGLFLPDEPTAALETVDAARLFIERAHRVAPHFDAAGQADDIIAICRLVGGMPLAIELAATWARSLTCAAIAEEIRSSLHFLTSHQRNISERHRSMRAVFDRSWGFLTAAEQATLRRLAIFQGDFQRDAAEAIAAATLPILTALVDKSLVRVATQGRYQLHELVRQYAAERLEEDEAEAMATRRHHAEFYLAILDNYYDDMNTARHFEVTKVINAEYENVRAAWFAAVDLLLFDALRLAADSLQNFFDYQARFVEATELLGVAYAAVARSLSGTGQNDRTAKLALARLGVPYGWALLRHGRLDEADACMRVALRIYDEEDVTPPPGFGSDPMSALGFVIFLKGDYATALDLAEASLRRLLQSDDTRNRQVTHYVLGNIHFALGEYDDAEMYFQRAYKSVSMIGNRWMEAYLLGELGKVAVARDDYDEAQQYYQACYALKLAIEDEQGQALALNYLADLAMRRGETDAARDGYARSAALYRRVHDRGGLITALQGQCDVALAQGDLDTAMQTLNEALQVVQQTNLVPVVLSLLVTSAGLLCRFEEDHGPCLNLLSKVLAHPACDHETRRYAQETLGTLELSMEGLSLEGPSELLASASGADTQPDAVPDREGLMQMVGQVQMRLKSSIQQAQSVQLANALTSSVTSGVTSPMTVVGAAPNGCGNAQNQALVEPMTERELEVLALLADGLSNQAIADELIIAIGTVKSYTSHIYGKLAVGNRTQAIVRARDLGII